jgi:hypothetical protein
VPIKLPALRAGGSPIKPLCHRAGKMSFRNRLLVLFRKAIKNTPNAAPEVKGKRTIKISAYENFAPNFTARRWGGNQTQKNTSQVRSPDFQSDLFIAVSDWGDLHKRKAVERNKESD